MTASRFIVPSLTAGLVILGANQSMAADRGRGAQLAAMCASCHRLDGRGKAIPSIVGMDKRKFADALVAYRSGARSNSIMHAVALQLSDGEIATLAEYFAARPEDRKRP